MGMFYRFCPMMTLAGRFLLDAARLLRGKLDRYAESTEGDQRHELRDLARELADWTRRLEATL